MNSRRINTLVLTAMLTAIVFLCTLLIRIPIGPECYVHFGFSALLLSTMILPRKYACFAGAVGTALTDLMGGYAFWALPTFIINLLCVLVFGFFIDRVKPTECTCHSSIPVFELLGYIGVTVVSMAGHFVSETLIFGNWIAAASGMLPKAIEIIIASIICCLAYSALSRTQFKNSMRYKRCRC